MMDFAAYAIGDVDDGCFHVGLVCFVNFGSADWYCYCFLILLMMVSVSPNQPGKVICCR